MNNTITIKNCKVVNEGQISEQDLIISEGRFKKIGNDICGPGLSTKIMYGPIIYKIFVKLLDDFLNEDILHLGLRLQFWGIDGPSIVFAVKFRKFN